MVSRSSSSSSKSRERFPEKKIPVLSVFQNCSIIKNIFVVGPSDGEAGGGGKQLERDGRGGGSATEMEEVVTVGRHPDNLIVLTHPSISRFHFKIVVKSSTHQLFLIDLASAHGTWVSGKKVEPGARVEVAEGDTIQIGASTRIYRLHWVPMSRADAMQSPPASSAMDVALVEDKEDKKLGLAEAKQKMATPQKEEKWLRARDSDELGGHLSGQRGGGVARRAVSEEFSSRVGESSERHSSEELPGMEEEVKFESPLPTMEVEVKSESPLPILVEEKDKEEPELQCGDSEGVFSREKEEGVVMETISKDLYYQDESIEYYSCEEVSGGHDSLDSSLPRVEEQEKSGCDAVEETENQCLEKEDRARCGMFELESVNLSLTEGEPTESSQQVLFAEGKEEFGSPCRKDGEAFEVSKQGTDSPMMRHEEASVGSLIEDQEQGEAAVLGSDSGSLCYISGELAGKEEIGSPYGKDDEAFEVSQLGTDGPVIRHEEASVGSLIEDQEQGEAAVPGSDSGNFYYIAGKEETGSPYGKDNEALEVFKQGTDSPVIRHEEASVGSLTEDQEQGEAAVLGSDSGSLCYIAGELAGKEEIGSPYGKDDEVFEVSQLGTDGPVIRHEEASVGSLIEDQEHGEAAVLGSDSGNLCYIVGKEETGSPYGKDNEALEVLKQGTDSPVIRHEEASVGSLIEDQEQGEAAVPRSDSGNLYYIAGKLAGAHLQQTSSCEEKEEAKVPLRNDDEATVVSNFGTCGSVVVGSKLEDNEISDSSFANDALTEGRKQDLSVIFRGESSDVEKLYSSLLFAAVKAHLDKEIAMMKVGEPSESALLEVNLSLTVENLLETDQQQVSLEEGKEDRNDDEVIEVPSALMKEGEPSESALLEMNLSMTVENLLETDQQQVSLEEGKEDRKDDEVIEVPSAVQADLVDSERASMTDQQQVSLEEGKEDRNDDEVIEVPSPVQADLIDSERESMKDQGSLETGLSEKSDSVSLSMLDENLSRTELYQVSSVEGKEGTGSSCENDDEVQEDVDYVSSSMKEPEPDSVNSPMMDEILSGTEMQQVSLAVGKEEDIASSCRNDDEVKAVSNLPQSVENLLEAELPLVSFEGKDEISSLSINDGEVIDVLESSFSVENLLEADLPFVSFDGKDEVSFLSRNDSEVIELPPLEQTVLEYGEGSVMKDQEHVEILPLEADAGYLSLLVENLSGADFQRSFAGKEDMGRSPCTDVDSEEVAELPNLATGSLADAECESGSEHEKSGEFNRSPDSLASLRNDHGSADVESEGGSKHEICDELDRSPDSPASLRSDHGSADLESKAGSKHDKFDELDRSPESPASLKSDHESQNVEFGALTRSPEWPSVDCRPPKRLNTEKEISMDDFDSLLSVETMEGDDLDATIRPLEKIHLEIFPPETDSMDLSEANSQQVSFSETSNSEAGNNLVVLEEDTFEEASPKCGNVEMETPIRSHMKVSNGMDLDTLFIAAVASDLNSNASPAEDSRRAHLDMSLFDSPASEEAVSKKGRSLSSTNPLDFGSSSPCDAAAAPDQEQKKEQLCPLEPESSTSPSQPVNNASAAIQQPEGRSFSVCTVSVVTESVSSSSFSIEELLSEIMGSEEGEESTTPQSVLATIKSLEQHPKSENSTSRLKRTSFLLKRVESGPAVDQLRKSQSMGKISSTEETRLSPKRKKLAFSGLESPPQQDLFTPDKENRSPNNKSRLSRSSSSSKITLTSRINTSPYKENSSTPEAVQQRVVAATTSSPSSSSRRKKVKLGLQVVLRNDRTPLQNLTISSPAKCLSAAAEQSSVSCSRGGAKTKKWIMIVDTASLLENESRKALQLLQGLRGTQLIIPRIVKNELESLKRTGRLFRRNTEAGKVLEWLEECESETGWWIHFQTSADETPLPPTPPASPESGSTKWYNTPSPLFSSTTTPPASPEPGTTTTGRTRWYSPFSSMPSPRREDHVLSSALFYKKLCSDGERAVLISRDPDLLVKAMAGGLICETAEEFRSSLVNPFSERFLWGESSPRGQTWSVRDDMVLKETYYPTPPHRKLTRGETSARGLKLVLLDKDGNGCGDCCRGLFPSGSIKTL